MNLKQYYTDIQDALLGAEFFDEKNVKLANDSAIQQIIELIYQTRRNNKKLIFIGNGGSAAIAGHMALDFTKVGRVCSICFNDGPFLTMLGNDYSFEKSFAKAVEMHANAEDVLVAISSSGESPNILNAVESAKNAGCTAITLSGFKPENALSKSGHLNVYINSSSYGHVEMSHHIILHCLLDYIEKNPA